MKACNKHPWLSRELGIHRRLLYDWRDPLDEDNPGPFRSREFALRKEITELRRLLANRSCFMLLLMLSRSPTQHLLGIMSKEDHAEEPKAATLWRPSVRTSIIQR